MNLQKISFKVPPALWESFSAQAGALFLARAPFLNHMIARETKELAFDLSGKKCLSLRAKRHISGLLKLQGAKSVNIEVEERTAAALNDVVREYNLVRDAFLCRLLIFLRGSDVLLNYLEVPHLIDTRDGVEEMPSSPMKALEAVRDDPLYYIRTSVRNIHGCGIYLVSLPDKLSWAACFLDDTEVPGTKPYKEERKMEAAFDLLECDAFGTAPDTNPEEKK